MLCKIMKSLVLAFCVIGLAIAEQTPVFLWGVNTASQPALKSVVQSDFTALLSKLLNDHMVIAFQENGLTNKDFLCSNDLTTESCYARLQGVNPKVYYPSVENPNEALRSAAAEREHNSVDKSGNLINDISCKPGKAVFITFDNTGETREAALESHDIAIASISKRINCNVVYLYMATASTIPAVQSRQRRAISDTAADQSYLFREGNQFLLYFTSLYLYQGTTENEILINSMSVTNISATKFSVRLNTNDSKDVTFEIVYTTDGYYSLKNIEYDGNKFFSNNVNSLANFAYFCGALSLRQKSTNDESSNSRLVWNNLQFQAPFSASTPYDFVFGDAWHCVGFFTPGILGGLFVVIILLAILFTGIAWMMDMKTMDRFDDPKGKTITINASE